jgi:hypothetical protein
MLFVAGSPDSIGDPLVVRAKSPFSHFWLNEKQDSIAVMARRSIACVEYSRAKRPGFRLAVAKSANGLPSLIQRGIHYGWSIGIGRRKLAATNKSFVE